MITKDTPHPMTNAHCNTESGTCRARAMLAAIPLVWALATAPALAHEPKGDSDEFPTSAIADYVLACMTANGSSFESLHQCSCSIDYIKARMPYKAYERAQTVMQVQMDTGQRGIFYRDSNWAKKRVDQLQNLQAESTLKCF